MIDILIVDDHYVVREGLRHLLADGVEFDVAGVAENAQEAFKLLRQEHVDVVLLDLFLPDSEGLKTLRTIKERAPEVAVLLFSGAPAAEHGLASLEAGAGGFVSKDCPPDELRKAIRLVMSGRKYIDPELAVALVRGRRGVSKEAPTSVGCLSQREREVMTRIARGEALTSIANSLLLSVKTVSTYRRQILDKLELSSNADLVRYALRQGLD